MARKEKKEERKIVISENKNTKRIELNLDGEIFPIKEFEEKVVGDSYGYKLTWTQSWAKDSGIKDMLVYDDQTLWYLMNYVFEWGAISVEDAPYFGEVLYWIDVSENIIKKLKPDIIDIRLDNKLVKELMRRTFENNKIKMLNAKEYSPKEQNYQKDYYLLKARIILRSMLRKKIGDDRVKSDVMLVSTDQFMNVDNKKDYLWGAIVEEFNRNKISNEIMVYDRLWAYHSWRNIISKVKKNDETKSFIGQYYNKQVFSEMSKVRNFLKEEGNKILKKEEFKETFRYKNVYFFDLISNRFRFVFNALSYEIGDCLAITKAIIERRKPKMIFIDHEDNFYGKGFMINSKKLKVKTASLQYELVYPGCIATHVKEDNNNKKLESWRPLPEIKFVGGDYIRRTLKDICNYPTDEIIRVVGQPRYDEYFRYARKITNLEKNRIKKELGLPNNKKIITYASSGAVNEKGSFEHILDFMRNNEKFILFVKIHPHSSVKEFEDNFDVKHDNIILRRDANLKELLPVTDVLVTRGSTVAMEAMIFEKPVVLINVEINSAVPYEEYGAALSVRKPEELGQKISQVFDNKEIQDFLKEGRKRFLQEYLYSNDGKTAKRIANEIRKEIR